MLLGSKSPDARNTYGLAALPHRIFHIRSYFLCISYKYSSVQFLSITMPRKKKEIEELEESEPEEYEEPEETEFEAGEEAQHYVSDYACL
jgi:hypothetical protein